MTGGRTTMAATKLGARRGVIDHFLKDDATYPEAALTYQPQRRTQRRALSSLANKGVVRLTEDGRYFVDKDLAAAWERGNAVQTVFVIGGALAGVAALVAWRRYRSVSEEK